MKMKSLIIWLPTGQTMKFKDVRDFKEVTTEEWDVLRFNYFGVSTGTRRNAVFVMSKLMGWSIESEDE